MSQKPVYRRGMYLPTARQPTQGHLSDSELAELEPSNTHTLTWRLVCEARENRALVARLADALEEALDLLRECDTSLGNFGEADLPKSYAVLRDARRPPPKAAT